MKNDILTDAQSLPDRELLARLSALAFRERESLAELLVHLAALEARPAAYLAAGFGSLFGYCTQALLLSKDAACSRIEAARACQRFPVIFDLIGSGDVTLTAVRRLGKHLTPENHLSVLSRARHGTRETIDALIAELDPQPDARAMVRRLSAPAATAPQPSTASAEACSTHSLSASGLPAVPPCPDPFPTNVPLASAASVSTLPTSSTPRPVVQATSPGRYRVQFTIGEATHAKLRRLQALLRREIPDGDPGAIFDRAAALLLEQVEKTELGAARKPRTRSAIRSGTDSRAHRSRHVPRPLKRAVVERDGEQCAFVSEDGRRCSERVFLEFHHEPAFALGGQHTIDDVALHCRRHNVYEAERLFGPYVKARSPGAGSPEEPR